MSKDVNKESANADSTISTIIKERETYSFTVSNKTNIDIAMQEFINNKIKSGTKMSSYIRYLIEKDMQNNGIVVDGYDYPTQNSSAPSTNNSDIVNKLNSLEQAILNNNKYGGQTAYDKLVNIEFLLKNTSMGQPIHQMVSQPVANPVIDNTNVLNKLELIMNLINSKDNSNVNYDLEFRDLSRKIIDVENLIIKKNDNLNLDDNILEKLSDIENLISEQSSNGDSRQIKTLTAAITKLSEQIDAQTELIDNLNDTIANQNKLIKMMSSSDSSANISNSRASRSEVSVDEDYDERREQAKKRASSMIESEF